MGNGDSRVSFERFEHIQIGFWLGLSLIALLYFGLISLHYGLSQDYLVQDDARQHVVWLQQFIDPELFPNDLIATYFQAVEPIGYKSFYWILSSLGVEPIELAKFLPIVLGLIATIYFFKLSLILFPVPISAFISTLIFNQQLWLNDDLISATPRAFVYPLFAAFLYYLLKKSLLSCLVTIALQGLFFPQLMLLAMAVLTVRLFRWQGRPQLIQDRKVYLFWLCGLAIAGIVLLPFALSLSEFGAVITAEQMRMMPEYGLGGRNEYFDVNLFNFIFDSSNGLQIPLFPSIVWVGFGLPFLFRPHLPLVDRITQEIMILFEVVLASLGMFVLAHLCLLRLHFPSRYTYHSWRFVLSIATGIVLTILLSSGWRWLQQKWQSNAQFRIRELLLIGLTGLLIITVIVVPALPSLFLKFQGWWIGAAPELYEYLATQPEDTLVASLAPEADNIPAFAQRSTLVGREFALPHHPKYYHQIRQRTTDLIQAQYSPDLSKIQRMIKKYGIDFWLIENTSFQPNYLLQKDWLIHSSFQDIVQEAAMQLQTGVTPAIVQAIDPCSVLSTADLTLLNAACIDQLTLEQ